MALHRIAARWRFCLKLKVLGWAAAVTGGVGHCPAELVETKLAHLQINFHFFYRDPPSLQFFSGTNPVVLDPAKGSSTK